MIPIVKVCLIALLSSGCFSAVPDDYKLVGQGVLKVFFTEVYSISLFTKDGRYVHGQPLALKIEYFHSINKKNLVAATKKEWESRGVNYEEFWLLSLLEIWPSVNDGDEILLIVDDNKSSIFYHNGVYVGEFKDAFFSKAFTDIWLSSDSNQPELRRKLLTN